MLSMVMRVVLAAPVLLLGLPGASVSHAQPAGSHPGQDVDQQALWSTPGDGRLVMLLRNGTDRNLTSDPVFTTPIPFRVRVCVTNFAGYNNVMNLFVWTTAGPQSGSSGQAAPAQPQVLHPGLGDCVEIDQPSAIVVQDSTVSGSASGYYQLFERTKLPEVTGVSQAPPRRPPEVEISSAVSKQVNCLPLGSPTGNYLKFCELKIDHLPPNQYGVRLCTGDNFVTMVDGSNTNYPPGYLELTTQDLRSITKNSDYNYNWNPVSPMSCRDVTWQPVIDHPASTQSIYFMVGPAQPVPGYDPAKVSLINLTMQAILLNNPGK
jgi:hypothetical protein